jgi:hypothetical protein
MYFVSKDLGYFDIISASTGVSSLRLFTGATSGDPYSTGSVRAYITADTGNTVTLANQAASPWLQYNGSTGFVTIYGNCGTTGTFAGTSATFSSSVTATAFYESSDIRFKNVLETNPIISTLGIDVIKFTRKGSEQVRYGYSAQQVQTIIPDAVVGEDELVVNYSDVHTLKIAALEKRIAELEHSIKLLIK